jgi:hypothetical protein
VTPDERDPGAVLREAVPHLAFVATERLYAEQPDLWRLGEEGRARTLEDFTHHLRALVPLSDAHLRSHVDYCRSLFEQRGFPRQWLDDAWRMLAAVLRDELPAAVADAAVGVLETVTAASGR